MLQVMWHVLANQIGLLEKQLQCPVLPIAAKPISYKNLMVE